MADAALTQHPYVQMHLASGAVRYRLGDYAAALPYLEHAVHTTENWHNAFDQFYGTEAAFFLALAQHRADRQAEAQSSLERAHARLTKLNAALDKPYPDMVWKLQHIRQEAETELHTEVPTNHPEN